MKNNRRLQIFALFLAILLWLYANGAETPGFAGWRDLAGQTSEVVLPLRIRGLPAGLVLPVVPQNVKVGLRGGSLSAKELAGLEAYIDLENIEPGEYWVAICVDLPSPVELAFVNPAMVQVKINEGDNN